MKALMETPTIVTCLSWHEHTMQTKTFLYFKVSLFFVLASFLFTYKYYKVQSVYSVSKVPYLFTFQLVPCFLSYLVLFFLGLLANPHRGQGKRLNLPVIKGSVITHTLFPSTVQTPILAHLP